MPNVKPRYPIYIPSKGRADVGLTAKFLIKDECPFYIVVEPQDYERYCLTYADYIGKDRILELPKNDQGVVYARNWIWEHSLAAGNERHWELDDNSRAIYRFYRGKRIRCDAGIGLRVCEDFTERYTNIAISGLNYEMFQIPPANPKNDLPPFRKNVHVYSCMLMLNTIPHRWRGFYNEDTDLCLQVLADGWCTIQLNCFAIDKQQTMNMKGGNTPNYRQDGRLEMSRSLERKWPGVVKTSRRFGRPQHAVNSGWQKFDTPLIRRTDIDWENLKVDEYGMTLSQVALEIKSDRLRQLVTEFNEEEMDDTAT